MSDAPSVIFDLDGTLIDSVPAIHAVSNAVLTEMGFEQLSLPMIRSFVGKGVPNLVRQLLITSGEDPDGPLFARVEHALIARYETDVEGNVPYPNVIAALDTLTEMGCRMAVCTNKPFAPAEAALRHVGLWEYFELTLGGDSMPTRKPEPQMLHHCHQALGGGAMIYVGDSEVDAETAVNAQAPFAIYSEGYRKTPLTEVPHDVAFSDWAMLPGLVEGWKW
ncbi:phosphoglycolate phosphatase [Thioclava sediminum]|uniref:phosphoglycolate phosphatase n=1 Tax=Thioclava sediminum TaxID=1915319 RepID=A0ABX3MUY4_9RHOB|nr:phosphoglycolate phosphatase [Thioclava sediminum]OOY23503.1 phosphoglycolate phosphatase [Thioclava sediminum]